MPVPPYQQYFPSVQEMNRPQRRFYRHLESSIEAGDSPDVEGNISYLFVYVYQVLAGWRDVGYERTHDRLLELAESYAHEPRFAEYCRHWAYDCLLGTGRYERYLELTEPEELFGNHTHASNLRLNVQHYIGHSARAVDLVKVIPVRYTRTTRKYPGRFRDVLASVFQEVAEAEQPWFNRMLQELGLSPQRYPHGLFQGSTTAGGSLGFDLYCFYCVEKTAERIQVAARDAENRLREELGVPRIGEGWIAETELYQALAGAFSETQVIQHGQPDWLGLQHFDIWFPRWQIAVERHGRQHFEPVNFFGGEEAFRATQARDHRKERLAHGHGVSLLIVTEEDSHDAVIERVREIRSLRARGES